MEAAPPTNFKTVENTSDKDQIKSDLKVKYKEILKVHLEGRALNEQKIKTWLNNILIDAKEYFIKKYKDYDIFLFTQIVPNKIVYRSNANGILITKTDAHNFVEYQNNDFYCILRFMYFKHYNLDYNIEEYEDEIIQKGDVILKKYLEDRQYIQENAEKNNVSINDECVDFILGKEKYLRVFTINKIYQKPVNGNYFFKYLCFGKSVYFKIIQTYENDYLQCVHFTFFFK